MKILCGAFFNNINKNNMEKKQKTKKQATEELLPLYNSMEVRKIKFSTLYKKIYKIKNGNFHCIGIGYDYTVDCDL